MDEILAYLKENPTYFYATVDANGDPDVRPFGTITKLDGALYIQTGKSKKVYEQAVAHPRGCISAFGKDGTWLRLYADFIPEDDAELCDRALEEYPTLQPMYKGGDGNCTLLRLDNIKATIFSFTAAPREIA